MLASTGLAGFDSPLRYMIKDSNMRVMEDEKMTTDKIHEMSETLATEAGTSSSTYWTEQLLRYIGGDRGPDMHDATLVFMSREYDPYE